MTADGRLPRFTGPEAIGMMRETALDEIGRMWG